MTDIVISEFMDEAAIADLSKGRSVRYDATLVDDQDRLKAELADARVLIVRNRTQVRGALLAAAPNLRIVGRLGVGLDNIDLEACEARGIQVFPATGANDVAVAEYVIAGILILLRGAYFSSAATRAGQWPRQAVIGREAMDKTIGLVGFGSIARHVARRALAFDMRVAACDPFVPMGDPAWKSHGVVPLSLDGLIDQADVISLHVPLTDGTQNMIDHSVIARMKPGAILINAARGGVVDETAVAAALQTGRLGGAMLDVFATEPLKAENPFADAPNLILTPHIAGVTQESNMRVSWMIVEKVKAALAVLA